MQPVGSFSNDVLRALLLYEHGRQDGGADIVAYADDDAVEIAYADALERALIRGIRYDGVGHKIRDGGDARFVTVYGKNLMAERAERLRDACAETANADYGK